jgi:hypothetical protein
MRISLPGDDSRLLGLLPTTSGSAKVLGYDCAIQGSQIRTHTGYMPEDDCLPPDVTATEFVTHLGRMSGLPVTAAKERAADSLRHVGLYESATGRFVLRLTIRATMGRKRALIFAITPVIMIALSALLKLEARTPVWPPEFLGVFGFTVVVPLTALIIGTSVLGAEIDDSSVISLLATPVRRSLRAARGAVKCPASCTAGGW